MPIRELRILELGILKLSKCFADNRRSSVSLDSTGQVCCLIMLSGETPDLL